MPIYTYRCEKCGYIFEDLVSFEKKDEVKICELCKSNAVRNAAETFGVHTVLNARTDTIYSSKEIDKVVGKDAEKKRGYNEQWHKIYAERQKKRWKGTEPAPVNIPRDADGKFTPLMHLGDNKQRALRKEYSEALQEHRKERESKGIKQFDAPGSIVQS